MKTAVDPLRASLLLVISCLFVISLACGPLDAALKPTRTLVPATVAPKETATATSLPSPVPTQTPTSVPTAIPPTVTASSGACPAPGSPALAQPPDFVDYPDEIQAYLSAGGDLETLRARLIAWNAMLDEEQASAADLNGDGADEVILSIVDPRGPLIAPSGILLVFECSEGAYVRRFREGDGETEAFDPSTEILQVNDLTMDGLADVVYVLRSCGAHTCYERLRILAWDGSQLANRMGDVLELPYPTYTVETGRIEAISGGIGSVGAEPQRGYREIWQWNGEVFTRTETVYQPAVYRYHALLDGDRALRSGSYVTATRFYERVINDGTLKEWAGVSGMMTPAEERAQLSAFARWRLVTTYLLMDRSEDARAAYEGLQQNRSGDPGGDVAQMARTFWTAHQRSGSILEGCATTVSEVETYLSVLDFFNENYGYANPHWEPKDLCPFLPPVASP